MPLDWAGVGNAFTCKTGMLLRARDKKVEQVFSFEVVRAVASGVVIQFRGPFVEYMRYRKVRKNRCACRTDLSLYVNRSAYIG